MLAAVQAAEHAGAVRRIERRLRRRLGPLRSVPSHDVQASSVVESG